MSDLIPIGNAIRDAYESSISDGHAAWRGHAADVIRVYHVPELPGDGRPVEITALEAMGSAGTDALDKLGTRITVEAVRQAGDETLVLETVFTGALPDGEPFRFPNTLIYTVKAGRLTQLIEVASAEMWSTLQQAMRSVGYVRPAQAAQ